MLLNALMLPICAPASRINLKSGLPRGYGEEQAGTHIAALQVAVLTITVLPVAPELPLTIVELPVQRAGTLLSISSIAGTTITAAASAAADDGADAASEDVAADHGGGGRWRCW